MVPASSPGWAGSCWLQWWTVVVRTPTGQVGLGTRRRRRCGAGGSEGLLGESEGRNGRQYRNGGSASSSCRPRSERGGRAGPAARRARVVDRGLGALVASGLPGGTRVRMAPTATFPMVLLVRIAPSGPSLLLLSPLPFVRAAAGKVAGGGGRCGLLRGPPKKRKPPRSGSQSGPAPRKRGNICSSRYGPDAAFRVGRPGSGLVFPWENFLRPGFS